MSPLEALEEKYSGDRWIPVSRAAAVLVAAFILWAAIARLDEVAVAPGEVVPQGQIKTIQHLEGGLIEDIYVQEGDAVREDAPLVQLDLSAAVSNIDELQVRLDSLVLTRARLEAEATGAEPAFPQDIAERRPQLASSQNAAFDARRDELESSLAVLRGQVAQREQDMRETRVRLEAAEESLSLAQERLAMSDNLLKDNL
ncbi:MAG: HlyD family type I secretion periplasmic adaptor subunit, partial [Rhodospirillaceae bacterium]